MREKTKHHDSDRRQEERRRATRKSIGLDLSTFIAFFFPGELLVPEMRLRAEKIDTERQ
jgi:hypothetical protein